MSANVKIEGLNDVIETIKDIADKADWEKTVAKACAIVERAAKQNAPKGNGELARSIASRVEHDGGDVIGIVYTPLEYAPYVEFGTGLFAENGGRQDVPWCYKDDKGEWHTTSGQHPQPFMRPALNENREQIKRILQEGLNG